MPPANQTGKPLGDSVSASCKPGREAFVGQCVTGVACYWQWARAATRGVGACGSS